MYLADVDHDVLNLESNMNLDSTRPTGTAFSASESRASWDGTWAGLAAALDPKYEKTTAALQRWVDGMEEALIKRSGASVRSSAGTASGVRPAARKK